MRACGEPGENLRRAWGRTFGEPGESLAESLRRTWGEPEESMERAWGEPGENLERACSPLNVNQSCSVSKETIDLTVTRGSLWSNNLFKSANIIILCQTKASFW